MADKEYIEREAVLNDIGELFTLCRETLPNEAGHHFIVEKELETHLDFVRNLPAADVRPVVRGRWIKCVGENGVTSACRCSLCGFEDNRFSVFNYCPNCGAWMEES